MQQQQQQLIGIVLPMKGAEANGHAEQGLRPTQAGAAGPGTGEAGEGDRVHVVAFVFFLTRTDSVQKVCGGIRQCFDSLAKFYSSQKAKKVQKII